MTEEASMLSGNCSGGQALLEKPATMGLKHNHHVGGVSSVCAGVVVWFPLRLVYITSTLINVSYRSLFALNPLSC